MFLNFSVDTKTGNGSLILRETRRILRGHEVGDTRPYMVRAAENLLRFDFNMMFLLISPIYNYEVKTTLHLSATVSKSQLWRFSIHYLVL